jgi:tRNA(His) 5'-end guanylyltransferase
MSFDELSSRMRAYEDVPQLYLMRRVPVIIRTDIRSGSNLTKGFNKPFDDVFGKTMIRTMEHVAKEIQGCIFAYTESDEMSFVLSDYKKLNSAAWFDYNVEKVASLAASEATFAFNKYFAEGVDKYKNGIGYDEDGNLNKEEYDQYVIYHRAVDKGVRFDGRCANYPKDEVANYIYWRQSDAMRNSVSMAARAQFPHSKCDNKNQEQLKEMLLSECGIDWNDYATHYRHGVCWTRADGINYDMPLIKGEDRKMVEDLVYYQEEY